MDSAAKHGLLTPDHPVLCKPVPKAYELVLEAIGHEASEVIFLDDSVRNISGAHSVGLMTVLVRSLPENVPDGLCVGGHWDYMLHLIA